MGMGKPGGAKGEGGGLGERLGETEAQRWEAGQAVEFGVLWGTGRELGVRMGGKGGGGGGLG